MTEQYTDPDRNGVYEAEHDVRLGLDHVGGNGELSFHGVTFTPETEPRFSTPDDVRLYVQRVFAHLVATGTDFGGRELNEPLVRARRGYTAAHYEFLTQTIAIPEMEETGGWALRGIVVWHEIAHHLGGQTDHGTTFRSALLRLLEALGLSEIAAMLLKAYTDRGLNVIGHEVGEDTLETMARILRQAEATDSQAERDMCLTRVQRLATRHQVALAVLRARSESDAAPETPVEETVTIGEFGQRGLWCYVNLMTGIMQSNNLHGTVAHRNTSMTLLGFRSDLEVAKRLFYSITRQMQAAWEQHLQEHPVEYVYSDADLTQVKKVATISRKNAFFQEYGTQVARRLQAARDQAIAAELAREEAADAEVQLSAGTKDAASGGAFSAGPEGPDGATGPHHDPRPTSTAMALKDRELAVTDAYREMIRRNNIRRSWRQPGDASYKAPGTAWAGMDAANRASLGGEKEIGSGR